MKTRRELSATWKWPVNWAVWTGTLALTSGHRTGTP